MTIEIEKKNPMKNLRVRKVVVNMAVGESGEKLMNAAKVLRTITGQEPSLRKAKKTIKDFGIRKGENIACIVTLREEKAENFLQKVFETVNYTIPEKSIDNYGNISFGIKEHIALPGVKYDPSLGIFGFDVIIVLERPGFRVARRRKRRSKIGKKHRIIPKEESIKFLNEKFGVKVIK